MKKTLAALLALCLALCLSACAAPQEDTTLVVGASPAPHAEILEFVKPMLAERGIDLQIEEFTDYVLPNQALEAGTWTPTTSSTCPTCSTTTRARAPRSSPPGPSTLSPWASTRARARI